MMKQAQLHSFYDEIEKISSKGRIGKLFRGIGRKVGLISKKYPDVPSVTLRKQMPDRPGGWSVLSVPETRVQGFLDQGYKVPPTGLMRSI